MGTLSEVSAASRTNRLGVDATPSPARLHHVQVVRAVAHCDRLGQRDPGLGGEPAQRVRLP